MTYTIETGIPVPAPRRSGGAPRKAMTPWTQTVDSLEPGQSVLTTSWQEMKTASAFTARRPDRVFAIRKMPGDGWRVWRLA